MNAALSVKSHFSLKGSILDPSKIGALAKDAGYDAVAIVDRMSVNGLVDLTKSCKSAGVKPIIGCQVDVYDDPSFKQTKIEAKAAEKPNVFWCPKLYAKNENGMKAIIHLLARANLEDYFYYTPRTGLKEIIEIMETGDVILLTGDAYGLFSHSRCDDIAAQIFGACSGSDLFIEIVPIDSPLYKKTNKRALRFAAVSGCSTVATMPVLYASDEEADSLDVANAIASQNTMESPFRAIPHKRDYSFKPISELKDKLESFLIEIGESSMIAQDMIDMAEFIANECQYEWKEMPVSLPQMAANETQALIDLITAGWNERLKSPILGYQPTDLKPYKDRLRYELSVLRKMKFERYFLLVSDIVCWAKDNQIYVGPGRGSCFLPGHRVILDKSLVTKPIELMKTGDTVIAHDGSIQTVIATLEFEVDEDILELEFDNGVNIKCTKDHKFFTKNRGWVEAEDLTEDDEFDDVSGQA